MCRAYVCALRTEIGDRDDVILLNFWRGRGDFERTTDYEGRHF